MTDPETSVLARNLNGDHLDRLLTVPLGDGLYVTDRIWNVFHARSEGGMSHETFVMFDRIPNPVLHAAWAVGSGWRVAEDDVVIIHPDTKESD